MTSIASSSSSSFYVQVRNLGKPVDLAGQYYKDGADEVKFVNSIFIFSAYGFF